jgi:hypothetical protein
LTSLAGGLIGLMSSLAAGQYRIDGGKLQAILL